MNLGRSLLAAVAFAVGASIFLSGAAADAQTSVPPTGWKLSFNDDFDGTSINTKLWYPNRWFASTCSAGTTGGELQYYTSRSANVFPSNGQLHLTARAENYTCNEGTWSGQSKYTSGWIETGGARASNGSSVPPGFTMGVGYVEARVWLPAGAGLWSAIWLLPTYRDANGVQQYANAPEIDIAEVLGGTPSAWHFFFHPTANTFTGSTLNGPNSSTGWHVVGVLREPTALSWYLDGHREWSYNGPGIPPSSLQMYLNMNLAIGGLWAGLPTLATPFPARILVDYVRIWTP